MDKATKETPAMKQAANIPFPDTGAAVTRVGTAAGTDAVKA
jgi:hypothetical protein